MPDGPDPLVLAQWQVNEKLQTIEAADGDLLKPSEGPGIIIIPPNLYHDVDEKLESFVLEWLKIQHDQGAVLCSICTAAFWLAQTGLLDGRPATTHWGMKDLFIERFPKVHLQTEQMVIDDGDIMTAGGVTAWIDLGLRIIDRVLGPSIMLEVAQFFLVDPNGREQRVYSKFSPKLFHGDDLILKVQHWLQAHYQETILIRDMAAQATLGERTFLRRFKLATGMKPLLYLQSLRVAKAREMLEFSTLSFHEISWKVGYSDPSAFRKIFRRLMGLSPKEYRRRFRVHH